MCARYHADSEPSTCHATSVLMTLDTCPPSTRPRPRHAVTGRWRREASAGATRPPPPRREAAGASDRSDADALRVVVLKPDVLRPQLQRPLTDPCAVDTFVGAQDDCAAPEEHAAATASVGSVREKVARPRFLVRPFNGP